MKHLSKFVKSYVFWTLVFGFWTWVFAGIDSCSGPKHPAKINSNNSTTSQQSNQENDSVQNVLKEAAEMRNVIKED